MKRIHYLQHDHFEDLAYIGRWAGEHGYSTSVTRLDLGERFPDQGSFDWLIIMGGKMGVYETDTHPWITDELRFIREAIDNGKVVMGFCLGSQMIAAALGARVYRNTCPEVGFFPVYLTDSGKRDEIFSVAGEQFPALHVHDDTFDLPDGATRMAFSDVTGNQAFRFGEKVFAFQFHYEVDEAAVGLFVEMGVKNYGPGAHIQQPEEVLSLAGISRENNLHLSKMLDIIAMKY